MKKPITYFIGGIASDERIFRYQLSAIENSVYLPFPKHDKQDTMHTYVQKFIPLIDTSLPFNLVGMSMGGIMTMELINHYIQPQKVVLISSIKSRTEMPFILKQMKYSNMHKLLPGRGFIGAIQFGSLFKREILKEPSQRKMAISMAKNNEPSFLYWCVNAIVKWNGSDDYRKDVVHIHGTKDEMFPIRNIKNAIVIKDGSHQMMLNKYKEVNGILKQELDLD